MKNHFENAMQNSDDTTKNILLALGFLLMAAGVLSTVMLVIDFSQPTNLGLGFVARGSLELHELIASVLVGFYHFVFGVICLGLSHGLSSKGSSTAITEHLAFFGWAAILVGVAGAGFLIIKTSNLGPFSRYGAFGAAVVAFYHIALGAVCIGLGEVLNGKRNEISQVLNPVMTTCSHCNKRYNGDLEGQFCEECGEKL